MASLFLSGFMGTGKSTLGPLVAARLGLRFVDVDALVASRAGRSAAELLRSDERAFRALEESIVVELASASEGSVVSLGGGSVVSSRARSALLDGGVLVTLRASEATILERTASRVKPARCTGRPSASSCQPSASSVCARFRNSAARITRPSLDPALDATLDTALAPSSRSRVAAACSRAASRRSRRAPSVSTPRGCGVWSAT